MGGSHGTPFKMKGSGHYGLGNSSPAKKTGIFKDVVDEETGKITQVRISDKESESVSHTRTGEDIKTYGIPEYEATKKKSIKKMKKEGTYKADVKEQAKIDENA